MLTKTAMSLAKLADLFTQPSQAMALSGGVQIVYVEGSYRYAYEQARAAGLEFLLDFDSSLLAEPKISVNHYFPPLEHNILRRPTPQLFHAETGLGGVSEQSFHLQAICLVVDDHVHSGQTLWVASEFLKAKGYEKGQIWVAASVHEKSLPYDARPIAFFDQQLAKARHILQKDLQPFFPARSMAPANSGAQPLFSVPQAIAEYCLVL